MVTSTNFLLSAYFCRGQALFSSSNTLPSRAAAQTPLHKMYTFVYRTFIKFILFCRGQALDAYNFGIFLANETALEKQKQQPEIEQQHQYQNKYHYQVNFSSALRIARKYFWRDSRTEKDIIHLMIKYVHAVKEELRQCSRPLRGIGAVHFAFR